MGKTKTAFLDDSTSEKKPKKEKNKEIVSVEENVLATESKEAAKSTARKIRVRGRKYKDIKTRIDRSKLYSIKDAVKLLKETSYTRFNGSVELHLVVRKSGISVSVNLPHGTGKEKRIEIADDKTVEKLKKGKIDFDVLLATPDMMPKIVVFAKILGPKGLMPNPKNRTLIKSVEDAKQFSTSTITVKTERKAPIIHIVAGKIDQDEKALLENIEAILDSVSKRQITKAYLCSTMSPSIKLDLS